MLEVKNLTLRIKEKTILENISFSSLGNLGIIGKSGSGKTSLLKSLIVLFAHPFSLQAKTLKVDGCHVLHLHSKALRMFRQKVGFISADIYGSFYPLSHIGGVFDSLTHYHYPKFSKKQRKHLSFEMMEKMGLDSLELIWHSYIRELSGGMARRIQIALCLVCGAKILLCDEITASLDEENAYKIIHHLKTMGIPVVFATHHLSHLRELCGEIIVLHNGVIVEQNSSASFFQSPQSSYAKSLLGIE